MLVDIDISSIEPTETGIMINTNIKITKSLLEKYIKKCVKDNLEPDNKKAKYTVIIRRI